MEYVLLLFVFFAIPFCVGAILGVLWQGRLKSLALFSCGLAAVCVVGWVVWQLYADPYRHMHDFRTFVGITNFAFGALIHFVLAFFPCFGGGVSGAMVAYTVKEKLARPPKLPVPPPAPAA